jgi:hypothetical protein
MVVGGASIVLCLLAASLEPVTLEWLTFFFLVCVWVMSQGLNSRPWTFIAGVLPLELWS